MRILISSASYIFSDHVPGGEYQIVHAIVSHLAKRGHRVYVLAPQKKLRHEIPNVTVYELGRYNFPTDDCYWQHRFQWWVFSIRAWRKARSFCSANRIDIIHHIRPAFPRRFSLCWALPRPFIYGPIALPWSPGGSTDGSRWKRRFLDALLNRVLDRLNMTLGRFLWTRTLERASDVPVSVPEARKLLPPPLRQQAPLIPLGVDTSVFCPGSSPPSPAEILFVGALEPRKGVFDLLHAFDSLRKHVPAARLTLVGGGRSAVELRTLADQLGLSEAISFEGPVPFHRVVSYYQRCQVFCLPSLGEPFGISLLQAMACGKPVVSTRAGGVPGFVEHGLSGLLVSPSKPEELSAALQTLLEDPDLCLKMGTYNRQRCLSNHSWDSVVDQIEILYRSRISSARA